MIIDAHLHVWDPTRADYSWLGPGMGELNRTIQFAEIEPMLDARGIGGVILVQSADNYSDTAVMLELARRSDRILGVVAFSPLDDAARLAADLELFAGEPLVVGIRNLVHEHPLAWMDRPEVEAGLSALERTQLPLDFPTAGYSALAQLAGIARRHPELPVVIDHLGKPPIGGNADDAAEWRELIAACAESPAVVAKVSGLYSSTADAAAWTVEQIRPFFDDAIELFGPSRLIFGGDWPISQLAGGYARTWDAVQELLAPLAPTDRDAILGATARQIYHFDLQGGH